MQFHPVLSIMAEVADARVICPDGVEKHADELSRTGEVGKMRRTKPISLTPSASWKHKIRFKLRQIPVLVRDLTSGAAAGWHVENHLSVASTAFAGTQQLRGARA